MTEIIVGFVMAAGAVTACVAYEHWRQRQAERERFERELVWRPVRPLTWGSYQTARAAAVRLDDQR